MGIKDLWNILEQVKQETSLASFRGKKLAVDFSSWFVKCGAIPYPNRSIFYKIVDLMSNGITPVFVFDSPNSLEFKARKRGESYFRATSQWKELLNEMGFPTLYADGEAEKACAQLNSSKAVVGCITDDGDVFAYGATTVLKNYRAGSGSKTIHLYELSHIEEKIGIGQKEMIAAAILIGCDYHKGVESVGRGEFKDLLRELRNNEVPDIIDRMRGWRNNPELLSIIEEEEKLNEDNKKKSARCSRCGHLGTLPGHSKNGCSHCDTPRECHEKTEESDMAPCLCEFHTLKRKKKPFLTELKVRKAALRHPCFPDEKDEEIISEFLSKDKSASNCIDLMLKTVNYQNVIEKLTEQFGVISDDTKNFFPALVKMVLYGQVRDLAITPVEFLRKCKKDGEPCYLIKFKQFEFDVINTENVYEIKVLQSVIDSKFPDLTPKDEPKAKKDQGQTQAQAATSKKRKRGKNDDSRLIKINKLFLSKKNKPNRKASDNTEDLQSLKTE